MAELRKLSILAAFMLVAGTVVSAQHSSSQLPDAIIRDISDDLRSCCCEPGELDCAQRLRPSAKNVYRHALGPAEPESIVVCVESGSTCGASGNCSIYLYRKDANTYRRLLVDFVQALRFLPTVHHGFYDFETYYHMAADQETVTVYRWNGEKYVEHQAQCLVGYGPLQRRKPISGTCPGHE